MGVPVCKYKNVSERDMDLLFIEAFATDPGFIDLFLNKLGTKDDYTIVSVERSKVDKGLGESDITVVYDANGVRQALLIEDKIDAIDMPDQHERYLKRGVLGVQNQEFSGFDVFIVCPIKYRETNEEAGKYEFFVSYEECRDYFASLPDIHSQHRYQQISQAIETMKAEYKVDINEIAVDSFQKYAAYQKAHYPRLVLGNHVESKKVNGWWPAFKVNARGMYILHKTNMNCVDLTISGAADRIDELALILKWLNENGRRNLRLVKTGKSAAFRIETPEISMKKPFETWKTGDLNACFDAIQELMDLAVMFAAIDRVIFRERK